MKAVHELRELVAALTPLASDSAAGPVALVTVVRTRGSTFRRVGAAMLVRADGATTTPLAGGCPHQDLVDRAREVIASRTFRYVSYNEEHGFDLLVESGCGGMLEVAIEPLIDTHDITFLQPLGEALEARSAFVMTTRFPASGTPSAGRRVIEPPGHSGGVGFANFKLDAAGCGVLVESFAEPLLLVIAGVGEEAMVLARLAAAVGIVGVIVASDEATARTIMAPPGWSASAARPEQLRRTVPLGPDTAIVAMTHHLGRDLAYLAVGAQAGAFYLGALGSRNRARLILDGLSAPQLHVPAGLDIGSNTPAEIALAVLAEVLAMRNGRSGAPLSATDGPLHSSATGPSRPRNRSVA